MEGVLGFSLFDDGKWRVSKQEGKSGREGHTF